MIPSVTVSDCMDALVRGGPSEDVFKYGMATKIGAEYFWDDDLDLNDKQVICGVYKISTSESISPIATSH